MILWDIPFEIAKEFAELLIKVIPYFLLGTLFGALLKTYLKPEIAERFLNKGVSSVLTASALGAILPGCSCATMPMADGLRKKGASLGTVTAFIMISPLLSPITLFLTYAMLGTKIALARLVFPFLFAVPMGIFFNFAEKEGILGFGNHNSPNQSESAIAKPASCAAGSCDVGCENGANGDCADEKESFFTNLLDILRSLSKYFLLGMFIATILTTVIPEDSIPKFIGHGALGYLTAVLIGIPLYVCEGEEVPITFALLKLGLGIGPAFTFLLGSVGTCIPTFVMAQKTIGRRTTFFFIGAWFVFAIGSGLILSVI